MSETEIPAPFESYERMVRQTRHVAQVTEQNVGQIAALIGGQVDYSGDTPVLVVPSEHKPWRVKVGWTLSWIGSGRVANANGFNYDETWLPTAPTSDGAA